MDKGIVTCPVCKRTKRVYDVFKFMVNDPRCTCPDHPIYEEARPEKAAGLVRSWLARELCSLRTFKSWGWRDHRDIAEQFKDGPAWEALEDLGDFSTHALWTDRAMDGKKGRFTIWQLSTGGPGDEFRIYPDGTIEYWFLPWYDGAYIELEGHALTLLREIVEMLDLAPITRPAY